MKKTLILVVLGLMSAVSALPLTLNSGSSVTFTGSSSGRSASATFSLSASQFVIVLQNTTPTAATDNEDLLQAIFWNSPQSFSLTGAAALTATNQPIQQANSNLTPANGGSLNVGKKFDYIAGTDVSNVLAAYNQGIGGAGYGIFSINPDGGNMNGVDLTPDATDQDYGLVSSKGVADPTSDFGKKTVVIRNMVAFFFKKLANGDALPSAIDLNAVRFQFGTSLTETNFIGTCTRGACPPPPGNVVPEPRTYAMLGLATAGVLIARLRRRK
jgi:hypothetical protein